MGDICVNVTSWKHHQHINGDLVLVEWQPEAHYGTAGVPVTKADHAVSGSDLAALVSAAKAGPVQFAAAMSAEFGAAFWLVVQPCGAALRAEIIRLAG